jgi:hypothetical protein
MKQNLNMVREELKALKMEMWILWQKVELAYLYHNQMEEFNNLKMEYAFM